MKRGLIAFLLLALCAAFAPAGNEAIGWYDLDTAVAKAKREGKKVWIYVYTDWCAWCKIMEKQSFQDPKIIRYLEQHFVPVKLNAWSKETASFQGKRYGWMQTENCHGLAYQLLEGKMEYPTTVILSEKQEILSPVRGYLDPGMMKKLLVYFGENAHTYLEWAYFKEKYNY
ncbi:MAG: DUF255 domain-containing protein [Bacteroidetes bacterium]|jgi:thioredoxin-related protein|nr:DUF255 domain-containing protein [Bacteroidota bacterium]